MHRVVEMNVAIIVASAPILPTFLTKLKTALTTSLKADSSTSKAEFSGFSSNASSCTKPVKIVKHNNTVNPRTNMEDGLEPNQWHKYSQPIIRTDSYEVTSHACHEV